MKKETEMEIKEEGEGGEGRNRRRRSSIGGRTDYYIEILEIGKEEGRRHCGCRNGGGREG